VHVEGWSIALRLGLAALTGVGFGVMPARRAAQLEPVAALRGE
jgi:ABC-type antimicrobial peptide transport system permease subunit